MGLGRVSGARLSRVESAAGEKLSRSMRESRGAGVMPRGGRLRCIVLGLLMEPSIPQAMARPSARPGPHPSSSLSAYPSRLQAPPNDNLADAITIDRLPFVDDQDATEATSEPRELLSSCVGGEEEHGIWYRLQLPSSAAAIIGTAGFGDAEVPTDTVLSVWQGPPTHPLDEIDCNDDAGDKWSRLAVDVVAGNTYFVKAGGQAGSAGHLVIEAETVVTSVEARVFLPFLARYAPIQ